MDFSSVDEVKKFRATLPYEEKTRFRMRDADKSGDTILALVLECIALRKRIEKLEGSQRL